MLNVALYATVYGFGQIDVEFSFEYQLSLLEIQWVEQELPREVFLAAGDQIILLTQLLPGKIHPLSLFFNIQVMNTL